MYSFVINYFRVYCLITVFSVLMHPHMLRTCFLECDALWSSRSMPTFQGNLLSPL